MEYKVRVPAKAAEGDAIVNSAAVIGRASDSSIWGSAEESVPVETKVAKGSYTMHLSYEDQQPVADWHINKARFAVSYACKGPSWTPAGYDGAKRGTVNMGEFTAVDQTFSSTVDVLLLGTTCQVTGMDYHPDGYQEQQDRYGQATESKLAEGYGYVSNGVQTVVGTKDDGNKPQGRLKVGFKATSVKVSKRVQDQTGRIDSHQTYGFGADCSLGSRKGLHERFELADGDEHVFEDLPIGISCRVSEHNAKGASKTDAIIGVASASLTPATPKPGVIPPAAPVSQQPASPVPSSPAKGQAAGPADTSQGRRQGQGPEAGQYRWTQHRLQDGGHQHLPGRQATDHHGEDQGELRTYSGSPLHGRALLPGGRQPSRPD
ncbi:hypothetical protein CRD60_06965 [Bifidobacterium aemilianum]|uniref:DUF5979 domain-containing protein n=1 Tax=Bifidobacterium aemilianum TaxID=2493120 RepID=A0A366K6I5_9BIFI|nr:hypothetical protein CRD60_06965 [Bifidobacterium aemilianum]